MQVTVNVTDKNIAGATRNPEKDPIARALRDTFPNASMIAVFPEHVVMTGVESNQWYADLPVVAQNVVRTFDLSPRKGGGRKGVSPVSFNLNLNLATDTRMRAVRPKLVRGDYRI